MDAFNLSEDPLNFLIENPEFFSRLSLEEKLHVKEQKPTPSLPIEQSDGKCVRRFQTHWYNLKPWLSGSIVKNKLFCFYCVLFANANENREWCKEGVGGKSLKNFFTKAKTHECTILHITAAVKYNQLGRPKVKFQSVTSEATRLAALKHNEKVDRNRGTMKRLISTLCFLARQELALRGHDESEASVNKGNYLELLDFLAEEEPYMKDHLISDGIFKGTSSDTQNELIACITDVIKEQISSEIENSPFISVQADETTDVSTRSQISVIFRYANNESGEIQERFIGFYDVSEDRSAQGIATVLLHVLSSWNIAKNKLVMQSYDGCSAMAGKNSGVHSIVKQAYPHALFVHCYAHHLNLVLLYACRKITEVKIFVANLAGFHNFFSCSSKRTELLRERLKLSSPCETRWNFHSNAVQTIISHYTDLKAAFTDVIGNDGWDDNSIHQAIDLNNTLNDQTFLFILQLYNLIFQHTSVLLDILQSKTVDIIRCNLKIENCIDNVGRLRCEEVVLKCIEEAKILAGVSEIDFNESSIHKLRCLAFEIIDTVTVNMDTRFQDFKEIDFIELVNEKKFSLYSRPNNFPTREFINMLQIYPFFDIEKLKGELMFIYSNEDKHLPPRDLLKFIINHGLKDVLPECVKLLSLVLAIPVTTASWDRSMSTLKHVKTFLRNTMTNDTLSNFAILAIEKGTVKSSIKRQEFISRVIDVYAQKQDRRIELIYKRV